jgi:hypothetical protein
MSTEYKVKTSWAWQDVKSCRAKWSKCKCKEFLASVGDDLEARLIEEGWSILNDLISIHEAEGSHLEGKISVPTEWYVATRTAQAKQLRRKKK